MPENIGKFQISVYDIMFVEMMEPVNEFAHDADGLIFDKIAFFLEIGIEISIIAVLQNQVIIIAGLFHIVEFDNVGTLATFQNLDLAFEELLELS